jgi:hypothetical protein
MRKLTLGYGMLSLEVESWVESSKIREYLKLVKEFLLKKSRTIESKKDL